MARKRQPSVPQVGLNQPDNQDESQKLAERANRRAERRARASVARDALREGMTGTRRESGSSRGVDHAKIREMLANPTKHVTAEDLEREYAHVLGDIRNMLLLSGALLVFMVILGNII